MKVAASLCSVAMMLLCFGLIFREVPTTVSIESSSHNTFCPSRVEPSVKRVRGERSVVDGALLPAGSNQHLSQANETIKLLWWVKSETNDDAEVTYIMEHSDKCTANWCQIPCAPVHCRVYFRGPTSVLNQVEAVVARPGDIAELARVFPERPARQLTVAYDTKQRTGEALGIESDLVASPSRLSDVWVPSHMDAHFLRIGSGDHLRNYGALTCAGSGSPSTQFLASAIGPHRTHIVRDMAKLIPVAVMGRHFEPVAILFWCTIVICVTPIIGTAIFCSGKLSKLLWIIVAVVFATITALSAQVAHEKVDGEFDTPVGIDRVATVTAGDHIAEISFMHHYKFALIVEQTDIEDDVSPALYYALISGSVPVYWGASNVDRYVPRNSIIKASDFGSMEELANHLIQVSLDQKKYDTYLQWKKEPLQISDEMASSRSHSICGICNAVEKKLGEK